MRAQFGSISKTVSCAGIIRKQVAQAHISSTAAGALTESMSMAMLDSSMPVHLLVHSYTLYSSPSIGSKIHRKRNSTLRAPPPQELWPQEQSPATPTLRPDVRDMAFGRPYIVRKLAREKKAHCHRWPAHTQKDTVRGKWEQLYDAKVDCTFSLSLVVRQTLSLECQW